MSYFMLINNDGDVYERIIQKSKENQVKAKFSELDTKGKLYVDCSECTRGGNGTDPDKCSAGWRHKKGGRGGCYLGKLIDGLEVAE